MKNYILLVFVTFLPFTDLFSQDTLSSFKSDLANLIGDKRIVLLGEMSHREGNVIKTNTEIVKYLHQEKGFNLILFESGFIDLGNISNSSDNYREKLSDAIIPVWSQSDEFQPLLDYLDNKKDQFQVGGFDLIFSSDFMYSNFVDSLKTYLPIENIEKWDSFFYVFDGVVNEGYYPFREFPLPLYISKINQLINLVEKNDFLQQGLKNYKEYLLMLKSGVFEVQEKDFKAKMTNPRDRQMAKNVIFYANKHPQTKIICWGASTHFAKSFSSFENEELGEFNPMGGEIVKQLGEEVITIGHTGRTGSYKYWFENMNEAQRIALNDNGKLENTNVNDSMSIIDLNNLSLKDSLFSSSIIEYTPLKGKWSEVFDVIILQQVITPMHPIEVKQNIQFDTSSLIYSYPLLNTTTVVKKRGLYKRGKISNEFDSAPVSYCLLKIKGTQEGTVCDENGNYELSINKGDTLLISSSGYEKKEIVFDDNNVDFKLKPSKITLNELMIFSDGNLAKHVFTEALKKLDANYDLNPYNLDFFVNHKIIRNNELRLNMEYCGKYYFSYYDNISNSIINENRLLAYKPFKSFYFNLKKRHQEIANPIFTSSLFQNKKLTKYNFEMLEDDALFRIKVSPKRQRYHHIKEEFYIIINPIDYAFLEVDIVYTTDPKVMTEAFYHLQKRYDKDLYPLQLTFLKRNNIIKFNKNYEDKYEVVYGMFDEIIKGYNEFIRQDVTIHDNKIYIPFNKTSEVTNKCSDKKIQDRQPGSIKYNKVFWENFNVPTIASQVDLIN